MQNITSIFKSLFVDYTTSFEDDDNPLKGWINGRYNDSDSAKIFDWTRQSKGTPSSNTGPSKAAEGEFYLLKLMAHI